MDLQQSNVGLHSSIVATLRKYRKVTVDFLASVLGMNPREIEEYLARLEAEGVVQRDNGTVSLTNGR